MDGWFIKTCEKRVVDWIVEAEEECYNIRKGRADVLPVNNMKSTIVGKIEELGSGVFEMGRNF